MFNEIKVKIKNEKLTIVCDGPFGKEKIVSVPLKNLKTLEFSKEIREAIVAELIAKEYGEIAVQLAKKKAA
jgi:hypothetical protein